MAIVGAAFVWIGGCADDAASNYEPNDTLMTAYDLGESTNGTIYDSVEDSAYWDDSDDYYAITLYDGDMIDIYLDFLHSEGDIDLALLNDAGIVQVSSTSTSDNESLTSISITVSGGGSATFYIRVYLVGSNAYAQPYDLTWDVTPATP